MTHELLDGDDVGAALKEPRCVRVPKFVQGGVGHFCCLGNPFQIAEQVESANTAVREDVSRSAQQISATGVNAAKWDEADVSKGVPFATLVSLKMDSSDRSGGFENAGFTPVHCLNIKSADARRRDDIERKLCIGSARRHITVQVMPFRFTRSRDSRKPIRFFCEFAGGTNIKRNLQPFRPHIGVVQEGEPYMDAALRFKREGNIADRYSRAAINGGISKWRESE